MHPIWTNRLISVGVGQALEDRVVAFSAGPFQDGLPCGDSRSCHSGKHFLLCLRKQRTPHGSYARGSEVPIWGRVISSVFWAAGFDVGSVDPREALRPCYGIRP